MTHSYFPPKNTHDKKPNGNERGGRRDLQITGKYLFIKMSFTVKKLVLITQKYLPVISFADFVAEEGGIPHSLNQLLGSVSRV